MGMNAEIIAIGKFSKNVKDALDYAGYFYDDVKEGTWVITSLFHCNTSSASRDLASALNLDPWDFNTHYFKYNQLMLAPLQNMIDSDSLFDESYIDDFKLLAENGFKFIYRPNG